MAAGVMAAVCVQAQTHKVAKQQDVVRAVGVYEWTGDLAKPTASRLIPITVFIDGKLEDGGEYLARPVPFALLSGNLYELDQAGLTKGNLELAYARHMRAVDTATGESVFDDGWFGYGSFKAPAAPRKIVPLKPSTQVPQVTSSKDDSKPHFAGKQPASDTSASSDSKGTTDTTTTASNTGSGSDSSAGSSTGSTPAGDPDRPTMRRRDGSSSSGSSTGSTTASTTGDTSTPSDDPDRPHLTRKTSTDDSVPPDPNDKSSGSGSSTTTTPASSGGSKAPAPEGGSADDPDRPTLKRRSPQDAKSGQKNSSSVSGTGLLADDPDRPNLHRGKPVSAMNEDDLPKLKGLPADLHQMVAVSDAVNRDSHDFARPWEDDAERTAILTKMQTLARAKLAAYNAAATATAAPPPPPAPKPGTAAAAAAARRAAAAKKAAPAPPAVPLMDEELKGFVLSYGGAPTYVYTAHTAGAGGTLEYVTIVAQTDSMGEFRPAIQSVTDAAHLDRTPRMRLVDAVDVEASNRASLLFELRGEKSRQFGIYRVIGAQANQTFVTGSTE